MAQSNAYDISTGQWSKYSGFKPLRTDRPEIRLLRLEKGADAKSLRYVICHADLSGSPKYSALSYSWGAPVPGNGLRRIFIHGEPVAVRPILSLFLEMMASQTPGVNLWIDALCINQGDVKERNRQISMMGEIYKVAQLVYVWLGPGDDDTNYAMEHIKDSPPRTRFDQGIFSTCAEKLLKASYWTRRWVIQEFALAQELTIVCGAHQTKWHNLAKKINNEVLDSSARRTLESFEGVRLLSSREPKSLLELMEQFQEARCVDRRDKAFALRAIAKDGDQLSPHYDESVADVYFRVLSMLPTERVMPKSLGYRWPHQVASRLQNLMQITEQDVLKSLAGNADDRFYTVFEYTGLIASVEGSFQDIQGSLPANKFSSLPLKVQLQGSNTRTFYGWGRLALGDLIYSLQTTPHSPKGLYIAFRPSGPDTTIVGMLIKEPDTLAVNYWEKMGLGEKIMELIRKIIVGGVMKCSRNILATSLQHRVLCHITRLAFVLLWLLDARQVEWLWRIRKELPDDSIRITSLCDCLKGNIYPQPLGSDGQGTQNAILEILPSFPFHKRPRFWVDGSTLPWIYTNQQSSQKQDQVDEGPWHSQDSVDFGDHKRTGLSYTAEYGHLLFTEYFLSENDLRINSQDDNRKAPLWWAAFNGHDKVVQTLLDKGADVNAQGGDYGTALQAASINGHDKVVQTLLGKGADVNAQGGRCGTALHAASLFGHDKVVQMLVKQGAKAVKNESRGASYLD